MVTLIAIAVTCLVLQHSLGKAESICSLQNGMTDELRQIFIDKHNLYRSQVARGLAENPIFEGFAPTAARMLKVSYDCEVEENMMEWLNQCIWGHSSYDERKGWGQNMYSLRAQNWDKKRTAASSVDAWFSELKSKGVPPNNTLTMDVFNRGVGHYSQLVWESSDKIGCGVVWCEGRTMAGCEYKPTGNYIGATIYEIGETCSKCKCDGCVCSKEDGLCTLPSATPKPTVTTTKPTVTTTKAPEKPEEKKDHATENPQKPEEKPVVKPETHCSLDNGMTDEVRQIFVDKHNQYRSLVAQGKAVNKMGGFAPSAAAMMKVSYDCAAEKSFMQWAQHCNFATVSWVTQDSYGQSLHSIPTANFSKTEAAATTVDAWFSELGQKGIPKDNILTKDAFNRGVGHYSQLVWEWSTRIGCGVVWCDSTTYVGCQYTPTGNWLNSLIYEIGNPCATDADCKCDGCTCSKNEALCVPPPVKSTEDVNNKVQEKPVTTTTPPPPKPVVHCPANNGMTDEIRQILVDKHNEYRSLIAKGQAVNKPSGFAPMAARMQKMSYDCKLEQDMMNLVKTCNYNRASWSVQKGQGQSIWVNYVPNQRGYTLTDAAGSSVSEWFDELAQNGVPQDNMLTKDRFWKINHYSQLAWQSTNKVGCAVVWCDSQFVVACKYNPSGNYIGSVIYDVGNPCTKDDDCGCADCKCSKDEALCIAP